MKSIDIAVREGAHVAFRNNAAYCVGTGRMGLALQREYQDQLRAVQALCGFEHIRGHGLFCGDMSIYNRFTGPDGVTREWYTFTYLDR